MRLRIARVSIELRGVPPDARLGPLSDHTAGMPDMLVRVVEVRDIGAIDGPTRGEAMHSSEWVFTRPPHFTARGTAMREMEVFIRASNMQCVKEAWLSFMRFLVSEVLLIQGGLALHAAAVARPRGAVVLLADSGGGKTTVARRFGHGQVLADDFCLIEPAGKRFMVVPSPFPGREGLLATGKAAPLWMLLTMRKSAESALKPSTRSEAIASVLRHAVGGMGLSGRKLLLDTAIKLVKTSQTGRLDVSLAQDPFAILEVA